MKKYYQIETGRNWLWDDILEEARAGYNENWLIGGNRYFNETAGNEDMSIYDNFFSVFYENTTDYKNWRQDIADDLRENAGINEISEDDYKTIESILNTRDYMEALAAWLNWYTPYNWDCRTMRGYSQGDWQNIVYRDDVDVDYIENVYFGKFTEYKDDEEVGGYYVFDNDDPMKELEGDDEGKEVYIITGYRQDEIYKKMEA